MNISKKEIEKFNQNFGDLQQICYFDPDTDKIEIVHIFNLGVGKDVKLAKIVKTTKTLDDFMGDSSQDPDKPKGMKKGRHSHIYNTFFLYFRKGGKEKRVHAKKFPERGTSYPIAGVPGEIRPIVFNTYDDYENAIAMAGLS